MATAFGVRLTLFPKILTYFNELTMMLPLSLVFYILKSYVLDIELKFQGEVTINITRKNEINVLKNPTYWRLLLSARLRFTIQFCNSNITKTAEVKKNIGTTHEQRYICNTALGRRSAQVKALWRLSKQRSVSYGRYKQPHKPVNHVDLKPSSAMIKIKTDW